MNENITEKQLIEYFKRKGYMVIKPNPYSPNVPDLMVVTTKA